MPGRGQSKEEQQVLAMHAQMQDEVMRFADVYSVMVAQGLDDFANTVDTPKARAEAVDRKASQVNAAVTIATGPTPIVNLMDMVVFVTLTRMAQEDYWVGKAYGDKARPLLTTLKSREDEIWKLAAHYISPDQLRQMHGLIDAFRQRYPEQHYTAFLRFAEFATLLGTDVQAQSKRNGSIFSLLYVDPLANLKPAVRQLEQTRYLAERAMYYGQRLHIIMQWRAEVVFLDLAATPEVQKALSMSERWTRVVEQLPGLVPREREAAINQFFVGVDKERTNLFNNLAAHEPAATRLLTNLQSTLATGRETAQAATELVKSGDELFQRYQQSQEKPRPTNARPFDIREYSTFMTNTANAATQLNTLFISGGQSLPKVQETGKTLADHIFHLALLFLVAVAVVAFVYRWLVGTFFKPGPRA